MFYDQDDSDYCGCPWCGADDYDDYDDTDPYFYDGDD